MANELIKFALAFLILAFSSRLLVRSLTKIARFLQVSDYAISFILMGFATSVPELFVAVNSGVSGNPQLSFGNLIGANILNVTLIVGIIALMAKGIKNRDESVKTDAWIIWAMAMFPVLLAFDGMIDRAEGFLLVIIYFWYLNRLWSQQKILGRAIDHLGKQSAGVSWVFKEVFFFLSGLVLLLVASNYVVESAKMLAGSFNLELSIFGVMIVALGTTVPELTFGIRSVFMKHEQMTLGNAIGSVAVNSTLILGLLALISPFAVPISSSLKISMAMLFVSLWLFNVFLTNDKPRITVKEGLILVISYLVFVNLSWLMAR